MNTEGSGCAEAENHTGAMIALFPSPSMARRLIVPGGEPADQLHITLLYLGKASDLDPAQRMMIRITLQQITKAWQQGYLIGKIGGVTIFPETKDGTAFCASVDVPNLTALREQIVTSLDHMGIRSPSEHGFTPHMTLKYITSNERKPPSPPSLPLIFPDVSLVLGDSRENYALEPTSSRSSHLMVRRVMQHPANGRFASVGKASNG